MTPDLLPTGVKRRVLDLLLRDECTAEEIAAELDVTGTAVRQHLATLQGLGLVDRRKADTRGGRPAFLYRLTEQGRRSYPKRHDLLSSELIETLLARDGRERTLAVVGETARRLAAENRARFDELAPAARWAAVMVWLEEELAWEADVEEGRGGARRVVLHQCPFRAVSADHPAVCGTFLAVLLERLTDSGPFVHHPIADGIACCALEVARSSASREIDETLL